MNIDTGVTMEDLLVEYFANQAGEGAGFRSKIILIRPLVCTENIYQEVT